jgi:hypothetical protein
MASSHLDDARIAADADVWYSLSRLPCSEAGASLAGPPDGVQHDGMRVRSLPACRRRWLGRMRGRTARVSLLLGVMVTLRLIAGPPALAADDELHQCPPVGRGYNATWFTAHEVPGSVRGPFGALRWSTNGVHWTVHSGYQVELCLNTTDDKSGIQFSEAGTTILGPDTGHRKFGDLTDIGYGYKNAPIRVDTLGPTGASGTSWAAAEGAASLIMVGIHLCRRRSTNEVGTQRR